MYYIPTTTYYLCCVLYLAARQTTATVGRGSMPYKPNQTSVDLAIAACLYVVRDRHAWTCVVEDSKSLEQREKNNSSSYRAKKMCISNHGCFVICTYSSYCYIYTPNLCYVEDKNARLYILASFIYCMQPRYMHTCMRLERQP